jgi:hypothetical protein
MREPEALPANLELNALVVEASQALARLDAPRLEELALSCRVLTRNLNPQDARMRAILAEQARQAAGDMAVFARVLAATRANLNVMNRLRELRAGRVEYTEKQLLPGPGPLASLKQDSEREKQRNQQWNDQWDEHRDEHRDGRATGGGTSDGSRGGGDNAEVHHGDH